MEEKGIQNTRDFHALNKETESVKNLKGFLILLFTRPEYKSNYHTISKVFPHG